MSVVKKSSEREKPLSSLKTSKEGLGGGEKPQTSSPPLFPYIIILGIFQGGTNERICEFWKCPHGEKVGAFRFHLVWLGGDVGLCPRRIRTAPWGWAWGNILG